MSYVNLGARKVPDTDADKGRERAASAPAATAILSGVFRHRQDADGVQAGNRAAQAVAETRGGGAS